MEWRKGSDCEGGACVEVAMPPGEVLVRNSLVPGEQIWFNPDEWKAFILAAKAGEFDL